jgi:enoyl-CoA hydratase/carnithine racemase
MEFMLTGDLLSGQEAFQMRVVNHVYSKDEFIAGAIDLAKKIVAYSPLALKLTKKAVDGGDQSITKSQKMI